VAQARHNSSALQEAAAAAVAQTTASSARAGEAGARFSSLAAGLMESASRLPAALVTLLSVLESGSKPLDESLAVLKELCRAVQASLSWNRSSMV